MFRTQTRTDYRPYFAWRPVKLDDYGWAWLRIVIRYTVHCHVLGVTADIWTAYTHPRNINMTHKEKEN